MDNLRNHKPVSGVLWQNTRRFVSIRFVQLRVSEDPKYDGQYSGNCLCCNEVRCVVLYLSSLKIKNVLPYD